MTPVIPDELRRRAVAWIAADPDPATRAELRALLDADDAAGVADRFAHPLRFGTAGLRAELGAGPARMNRLVVRRTTAGLARWLRDGGAPGGLVVGRDARHGSAAFAADTVEVAAALGVAVHPFARALPTPVTAFAVRHLGGAAGVQVTASHNPPADNGYKVYVGDGAQIIPPDDAAVAAAAEAAPDLPVGVPPAVTPDHPVDDDVLAAYRAMALGLLSDPARELRIVYTPMHGVGGAVLPGLLEEAGYGAPVPVARQSEPDPDFPTVAFPNPEEPGAMDLALAIASDAGADVVIANDPDADRLAVAVPGRDGAWRLLSGDELGILLADHRLATTTGPDRVVATTIVSSSILRKLAAAEGVEYRETLTGFKWVARSAGKGRRLTFGYEEALGYAVTDAVADKDGMTAALLFAELAGRARGEGRSPLDRLDDLSARLGVHLTGQWTTRGRADELAAVVESWRRDPPASLAGAAVTEVVDFSQGAQGLPPTDAVRIRLGDAGRVVLRPSGTEPKLKVYLEVATAPPGAGGLAEARREAAARMAALRAAVIARSTT